MGVVRSLAQLLRTWFTYLSIRHCQCSITWRSSKTKSTSSFRFSSLTLPGDNRRDIAAYLAYWTWWWWWWLCLVIYDYNFVCLFVTLLSSYFSCMRVMNHNWSARKQRLHQQSVAEISRNLALSEDRIRQCGTSSGSRHKDTDQCL